MYVCMYVSIYIYIYTILLLARIYKQEDAIAQVARLSPLLCV